MNKLLLASLALVAAGMTAPAKAADMPVKYVAPAPVFTWTGCYVGLHVGYKWGESKHSYPGTANGVPFAVPPFLVAGADLTDNFDVNGPVGGAQGGCNYQTGNWVWGVEVDGAWTAASGQANPTAALIGAGAIPATVVFHTDERWLATARGRIGWAADRWMWYVTGGVAYAGFDLSSENPAAVPHIGTAPQRLNRTGWIVGVGTEYALLGGWSVKSEWLYTDFGSFATTGATCAPIAICVDSEAKMSQIVWRVGMNYRFDWATFGKGKAPAVVAKY